MAHVPIKEEVREHVELAKSQDKNKLAKQKKQGKEFVNNGQCVIPEAVWKNLPGKTEVA